MDNVYPIRKKESFHEELTRSDDFYDSSLKDYSLELEEIIFPKGKAKFLLDGKAGGFTGVFFDIRLDETSKSSKHKGLESEKKILRIKKSKLGVNLKIRAYVAVISSFLTALILCSGVYLVTRNFYDGLLVLFLSVPGFGTTLASLYALCQGDLYDAG